MKITLQDITIVRFFKVVLDDRTYNVKVYTNPEKDKFIDWEVTARDGEEIEDGVEDSIIDKIDDDWDNF